MIKRLSKRKTSIEKVQARIIREQRIVLASTQKKLNLLEQLIIINAPMLNDKTNGI